LNADLQKLRHSRLFRHLPDRAFERLLKYIKVRAFDATEKVADLESDTEFRKSIGYVIAGGVLFVGEKEKPLGIAVEDEFFLGRAFSISENNVRLLISTHPRTLVVWFPKEILEILSSNSSMFAEIIEEVHDSIYDRAELIAGDSKGAQNYREWLRAHGGKIISDWLGEIEKKRIRREERLRSEKRQRLWIYQAWFVGLLFLGAVGLEAAYRWKLARSFFFPDLVIEAEKIFSPGSNFNIGIGIIGYSLIILTTTHGLMKWGLKKFKWKFNYKVSSQLHILFGFIGTLFIIFHTGFQMVGANVAQFALYALLVSFASGLIGQLISAQIPKTIQGEKIKLGSLKKEQEALRKKAELLMDDQQFMTSIGMISSFPERSFWASIFLAPLMWLQAAKVRRSLKTLGLGKDSAALASKLIRREAQMRQKIKSLEIANVFFKRWMNIHKPIGYAVYALGALHIFIAMVLS